MTPISEEQLAITRREAIQRVSALLGGVALVGGSSLLAACARDRSAAQAGVGTFSVADIAYLDEIAETILPETNTPGAKAAKVGAFMALMVTDTYKPEDQAVFRAGMKQLDEASVKESGTSFMSATPQQRLALLEKLDKEAKDYHDARDERKRLSEAERREREEKSNVRDAPPKDDESAHYFRHDEGADAARLLHIGDRLHPGAALRRSARKIRAVHPLHARRANVGGARLTSGAQPRLA